MAEITSSSSVLFAKVLALCFALGVLVIMPETSQAGKVICHNKRGLVDDENFEPGESGLVAKVHCDELGRADFCNFHTPTGKPGDVDPLAVNPNVGLKETCGVNKAFTCNCERVATPVGSANPTVAKKK